MTSAPGRSTVGDEVRALVDAGNVAAALELFATNWRSWLASGDMQDGMAVADLALGARGADAVAPWRARALYADGVLAFRAGEDGRSRARNEELLETASAAGDVRGQCDGLTGLARLALREGDYAEVVRLARAARERAAEAGDPAAEAAPLHLEAAGTRLQQRYDEARDLYLQSLDLNTRLGNAGLVTTEQHNLGWVELHRGDVDAAERRFRERDRTSVADVYGEAWSELNWAAIAAARREWAEAERRYAQGARALADLGVTLDPDDAYERAWLEAQMAVNKC